MKKHSEHEFRAHAPGGYDRLEDITEAVARGVERGNRRVRKRRLIRKLITLVVVLVLAAAALLVWRSRGFDQKVDAVLGNGAQRTTLDYKSLLLGDAVERGMFVVLEQEAQVESAVSQSLLGLDIFKVTRTIHAPAKGCFAVDTALLTEADITVNESVKTITISVPSAELYTFEVDFAGANFEDTDRGLLAIGDLSLTMEQNAVLTENLNAACRELFGDAAVLEKADALAVEKLSALFGTVVRNADPSMTVIVKTAPRAEAAPGN